MATESVDVLIEGGKASAAPPLGPALGPMGVNIGQVVADINKKTAGFKGMQVPVTVTIDTSTKSYTISVGTPPASALIKKEAGIQKGAGNPLLDKVADLAIEQVIKITIMKEDNLLGKDFKMKVREIVGTCQSMGVLVEGKPAQDALKAIAAGKYDSKISTRKTEISAEERQALEEEKDRLKAEMEERREELLETAKGIVGSMTGADRGDIKAALTEAGVPSEISDEVLPEEQTAAEAAVEKSL
jgi:large subunit ribosomal protein L11